MPSNEVFWFPAKHHPPSKPGQLVMVWHESFGDVLPAVWNGASFAVLNPHCGGYETSYSVEWWTHRITPPRGMKQRG